MTVEYVHVGRHADILASCRHIGPRDRVSEDELDLTDDDHVGEDQHLVDEGRLVDVASFTVENSNAEQLERDEPVKPTSSVTTKPPAAAEATDKEGA